MKYGIILPVRNGGHYIKECVASILSQSYKKFNFIILDNCSTDGTLEWLKSIDDERIKVIPSEKSLSIEDNWSRIIQIEKNEFITLIGHDDILHPDFLETMDGLIESYPYASLFHSHYNFIDDAGKIIRPCKPMKQSYNGSEFLDAFLTSSIDSMGTGYMMRSADYDAIGGIQSKYPNLLFADFELWTSLAAKKNVVISPNNCFAFRVHKSTTHSSSDYKIHKALHIFVEYLAKLKSSDKNMENVIQHHGSQFLLTYCAAYAHRLMRQSLKNRNGIKVDDFIKETKVMAKKLGVDSDYMPEKKSSLQLAKRIDNSKFLSFLFLLFKRMYAKPILK